MCVNRSSPPFSPSIPYPFTFTLPRLAASRSKRGRAAPLSRRARSAPAPSSDEALLVGNPFSTQKYCAIASTPAAHTQQPSRHRYRRTKHILASHTHIRNLAVDIGSTT